eukprot:TRINITY_DN1385_c0_g2_i2.p1 TRINITY_DN1385_c0_g2~~TRINITY_DN1385_c0_g2_i2.p1  ORF type:complete len:136 (-),score=11.62 TRINITY_DN1385_c0_g2_i2:135-542(-)
MAFLLIIKKKEKKTNTQCNPFSQANIPRGKGFFFLFLLCFIFYVMIFFSPLLSPKKKLSMGRRGGGEEGGGRDKLYVMQKKKIINRKKKKKTLMCVLCGVGRTFSRMVASRPVKHAPFFSLLSVLFFFELFSNCT